MQNKREEFTQKQADHLNLYQQIPWFRDWVTRSFIIVILPRPSREFIEEFAISSERFLNCLWIKRQISSFQLSADSTHTTQSVNLHFFNEFFLFFLSECHFGKELKELGSTWFPDLGAPFGKMYCIKCECVPVSRVSVYFVNI